MSGLLWEFSDLLDDEDILFAQHDFISFRQGQEYYGLRE